MQKYFLGIDVSKGYADFVVLNDQKHVVVDNFQLDDTFVGHNLLYQRLDRFFKDHPQAQLHAAVESTGGYENNWFSNLLKFKTIFNLKATRLNPWGVNANSQADLKRNVTDKISATNVAEYLISHPEKVSHQHQDLFTSMKKQWGFVKLLTKQHTQLLNQLESLVYTANPELLPYCHDAVPQWVLKVLAQYPTARNLARARSKRLIKIPYVTASRAKELITAAKTSVASSTDQTAGQLIQATVKQILHLHQTIKTQTQILAKNCTMPEIELLKTFIGVSDYSAIGLMIEIVSITRFASAKKLASFFGLHPVFKKSGDKESGMRMSKKGRVEPRRILYMVVMSAIKSNPLISKIYQARVKKGMARMAALGLCMHKTLRIIYGMLKNNSAFDPQIDLKNQEKTRPGKTVVRKDKNRRYQNYDKKAPISGRQNRKRKEREESQNGRAAKCGIIAPVPVPA